MKNAIIDELFCAEAEHVTRRFGSFTIRITQQSPDRLVGEGMVVLSRGVVEDGDGVLCRVASACLTSTALNSADCDCAQQIDASLEKIAAVDCGVLMYLTDHEGRGHGLANKVRALAQKNKGLDTFAAVEALGLKRDVRRYSAVAPILDALRVRSVILLTNSPDKAHAIIDAGVKVDGVEHLWVEPPTRTRPSMRAKRDLGHTVIGRYVDEPEGPYP